MAEDQRQLEYGVRDQPPGTFQLIRGKVICIDIGPS